MLFSSRFAIFLHTLGFPPSFTPLSFTSLCHPLFTHLLSSPPTSLYLLSHPSSVFFLQSVADVTFGLGRFYSFTFLSWPFSNPLWIQPLPLFKHKVLFNSISCRCRRRILFSLAFLSLSFSRISPRFQHCILISRSQSCTLRNTRICTTPTCCNIYYLNRQLIEFPPNILYICI